MEELREENVKNDTVEVNTPDGTLIARSKKDEDYPGIELLLKVPGQETPLILAWLEYNSGYAATGYDPKRPELAKKELTEVPQDRLDKSGAYPCVTPGITLYSWQDPNSDEENTLRRTIFSNYIKE